MRQYVFSAVSKWEKTSRVEKVIATLRFICLALSLFMVIWMLASIVDVDMHNMPIGGGNTAKACWNIFELMVR